MTAVVHESLALDGYWRFCSYGRLTNPPTRGSIPRIRAYLLPVTNWPDRPKTNIAERHAYRDIPVGEMPLLHINAVLYNGRIIKKISSPWEFEQRQGFTIDVSKRNLSPFHRHKLDDSGQLIVPDKYGGLKNDPEAHAIFLGIGVGTDPYAYIVPCTEILRFFYATSSAMIRAVLSDEFLDPNRNLWDIALSHILPDGNAFIQLRKRMFDVDAPFLARFAFSGYAQTEAREIFLCAAGARREDDTRTIRALPPFEGKTHVVAYVIPIHATGRHRWLITRLLSCDWKPPFTHLEYQRDNDGRKDERNIEERDPTNWTDSDFNRSAISPGDPPDIVTLENTPASTDLNPWSLRTSEISERFPELVKVPVNKLPRKVAKTLCDQRLSIRPMNLGDRGSVDGVRTSSDLLASVLVSGLQHVHQPKGEVASDVDPAEGDGAFKVTTKLLRLVHEQKLATVDFLVATDQIAIIDGVRYGVLPDDLGYEGRAWLYMDTSRTHRRLVLVASIYTKDRYRYLIDFQQKRPKECSMVALWGVNEEALPIGYLSQAVFACMQARGASLRHLPHLPIQWSPLKHTADSVCESEARRLLRRTYRAQERMDDPDATGLMPAR